MKMRKFCVVMIGISVISIIANLVTMANGSEFGISNILSTIMSIIGFLIMFRLVGEMEEMEYGVDDLEEKMEYRLRNGRERE